MVVKQEQIDPQDQLEHVSKKQKIVNVNSDFVKSDFYEVKF
jgi:hypothetical protein